VREIEFAEDEPGAVPQVKKSYHSIVAAIVPANHRAPQLPLAFAFGQQRRRCNIVCCRRITSRACEQWQSRPLFFNYALSGGGGASCPDRDNS
jgi:hypothetical protein